MRQQTVKLVCLAAIGLILAFAAERLWTYLRRRKADPTHDKKLWGFKLSLIILLLSILVVLALGWFLCSKCDDSARVCQRSIEIDF